MATEETPSFDDLDPVETPNDNDDDVPTINLDPGARLVAEIRHIERDVGKYGNSVLHMTRSDGELVKMWSNTTIDRKLDAAGVGPGDTVGIKKSEESYTYETDDGEQNEAYEFEVRVL